MSNEPTPEMDAFQSSGIAHYMALDFALELTRKLAQSQEANAGLMKACDALERKLAEVTKQRDRLAKAIITHRAKAFPLTGEDFDQELWQALQSLTTNEL
jgi:molecular chaperone GrpE (heat shock protein)